MEFNQTVMARRSLRGKDSRKGTDRGTDPFCPDGSVLEKFPDRQILCCNVTGNAGKSKKRLPSGI